MSPETVPMTDSTVRLADAVANTLQRYGVTHFFQVTGGDPALWTALEAAGIRMVACRSEAGAVYMADGYARASGKPGLVYGQHGPGAANVAAALADANWAMSPVVSLTSSMPAASRHRHEYQDLDQVQMMAPVTRWRGAVTEPTDAPRLLATALEAALSTPGPTHLEIPRDLFEAKVPFRPGPGLPRVTSVPGMRARPDPTAVAAAVKLIRRAKRPLILAGAGILLSRAQRELAQLAELLGVPVATSPGGKGAYDEGGALAVGVIGRYAGLASNAVASRADLVLVVGCNLDGLVTDGWQLFGADVQYVQVDVDVGGFLPGANVCALRADAKLALADLAEEWRTGHAPAWRTWATEARSRIAEWRRRREELAAVEATPLHPATVMSLLRAEVDANESLVADTGYMTAWTATMFDVDGRERSYFRAAGSLGWSLPAAIGVALARPEATRVFCIIGDGGLGYHVAELETAARLGIPIVICVLNNGTLAFEYHIQRYLERNVISSINDLAVSDYAAVARTLGVPALQVHTADELRAGLAHARDREGPLLIDIVVDRDAIPPVTTYDSVIERSL